MGFRALGAMHKLGFPIWYGYGPEISKIVEEAHRIGFDYIEISIDYPWPRGGEPSLSEVMKTIRGLGLSLGFHAPWRDLRLSSPFDEIRNASIKIFEKIALELSAYECDYLVAHLSTDQAVDRIDEIRGEVVEAAIASAETLVEICRSLGLRLLVENVREDLEMFERIASRADGVCLDLGHVIISTARRLERDKIDAELERWLSSLKDKMEAIHYSGVKFDGKHARDHQLTDSSDKYLRLLKRWLTELRPRHILLEVFEGAGEEHAWPRQLADAVRFLKASESNPIA
ncbi:MAG: sugar phosphate isomerase/epimerase [Nitrososphaerota archaeon]